MNKSKEFIPSGLLGQVASTSCDFFFLRATSYGFAQSAKGWILISIFLYQGCHDATELEPAITHCPLQHAHVWKYYVLSIL